MNIREYKSEDYVMLTKWWQAWDWQQVPEKCLPSLGLIVTDLSDEPICACFLYQTDSSICWIEWIVSNPEVPKGLRREALDLLLKELKLKAKRLGFKQIFTSTDRESLKVRLVDQGFLVTDKKVDFLICPLGG